MNGFHLFAKGKEPHTASFVLEGKHCPTKEACLRELAKTFHFPKGSGLNLDAAEEMLNDLSWLDQPRYSLLIRDYPLFLQGEEKTAMLDILHKAAKEWETVPNYPGEEAFRKKAVFDIYVEDGLLIREDLKAAGIPMG